LPPEGRPSRARANPWNSRPTGLPPDTKISAWRHKAQSPLDALIYWARWPCVKRRVLFARAARTCWADDNERPPCEQPRIPTRPSASCGRQICVRKRRLRPLLKRLKTTGFAVRSLKSFNAPSRVAVERACPEARIRRGVRSSQKNPEWYIFVPCVFSSQSSAAARPK